MTLGPFLFCIMHGRFKHSSGAVETKLKKVVIAVKKREPINWKCNAMAERRRRRRNIIQISKTLRGTFNHRGKKRKRDSALVMGWKTHKKALKMSSECCLPAPLGLNVCHFLVIFPNRIGNLCLRAVFSSSALINFRSGRNSSRFTCRLMFRFTSHSQCLRNFSPR